MFLFLSRELYILKLYLFLQEVLDEIQLKLKQPKDVRLLSHDAATSALYRLLRSVLVHLISDMNKGVVMARALWGWLHTYKAIATLYLLCDILPHLSALSKCFQQKSLDLTEIQRAVEAKKQVVREARDAPLVGGRLDELDQDLGPEGRLYDLDIMDSVQQRQQFSQVRREFIDNVIENMEGRFPQMDLLSAFSALDPARLPTNLTGEYGWQNITTLSEFYSEGPFPINRQELRDEWIGFRQQLAGYRGQTPKVMCQLVSSNVTLSCQYPNIKVLYNRMVVIPAHTADCERAFSALKRVKTRLRSTLTAKNLNHLLMVRIEGPDISQFNFDQAVERWGGLRNRKILI